MRGVDENVRSSRLTVKRRFTSRVAGSVGPDLVQRMHGKHYHEVLTDLSLFQDSLGGRLWTI